MSRTIADRSLATAQVLLEAARERGLWVSADARVDLAAAAQLVGIEVASLRNAITQGRGPATYRLGAGNAKRTVRLLDLATWIEALRD